MYTIYLSRQFEILRKVSTEIGVQGEVVVEALEQFGRIPDYRDVDCIRVKDLPHFLGVEACVYSEHVDHTVGW